uniref:Uncharacterized protein n=1 Tax=Ditylenchus dipsaci TaxID=166011 RepID=A0A915E7T7_9BILA
MQACGEETTLKNAARHFHTFHKEYEENRAQPKLNFPLSTPNPSRAAISEDNGEENHCSGQGVFGPSHNFRRHLHRLRYEEMLPWIDGPSLRHPDYNNAHFRPGSDRHGGNTRKPGDHSFIGKFGIDKTNIWEYVTDGEGNMTVDSRRLAQDAHQEAQMQGDEDVSAVEDSEDETKPSSTTMKFPPAGCLAISFASCSKSHDLHCPHAYELLEGRVREERFPMAELKTRVFSIVSASTAPPRPPGCCSIAADLECLFLILLDGTTSTTHTPHLLHMVDIVEEVNALMRDALVLLTPFHKFTLRLQTQGTPTISLVLPGLNGILNGLEVTTVLPTECADLKRPSALVSKTS